MSLHTLTYTRDAAVGGGRVKISCRFVWMFARLFVSLQRNFTQIRICYG